MVVIDAGMRQFRRRPGGGETNGSEASEFHPSATVKNYVYSPPLRGLAIHFDLSADASAGVECCWKPGGRPV